MQFLILVCIDSSFDPPSTLDADTDAWVADVDGRGLRITGDVIAPPSAAVTVGHADGELVATRGRRVDADEQIVGFDLFEAGSMDEVVEAVRHHPMARLGRIEIRAVGMA